MYISDRTCYDGSMIKLIAYGLIAMMACLALPATLLLIVVVSVMKWRQK